MHWDVASRSSSENYHFLLSTVMPRPIAWITTLQANGKVNLAPFSWYQTVCANPPTVIVAVQERDQGVLKDTARNILRDGECVVNGAPASMAQQIVDSSLPFSDEESELDELGLHVAPSVRVRVPGLAEAPFRFEAKMMAHHILGTAAKTHVFFLEILHIHADHLDERGNHDTNVPLLARMGGKMYTDSADRREIQPNKSRIRSGDRSM